MPGEQEVISRKRRTEHVPLCRNILTPLCEHLCVVLIKRILFQWRQRDAQDVHSMLSAHTQMSSDQASSGIWHTEKNGMLGFFKARWEAGSSTGLCLSDVKWISTEGPLKVLCGNKGTFRELSKLLLISASGYYSLRCSVFVSADLLVM